MPYKNAFLPFMYDFDSCADCLEQLLPIKFLDSPKIDNCWEKFSTAIIFQFKLKSRNIVPFDPDRLFEVLPPLEFRNR
jgi:hypothetical protein